MSPMKAAILASVGTAAIAGAIAAAFFVGRETATPEATESNTAAVESRAETHAEAACRAYARPNESVAAGTPMADAEIDEQMRIAREKAREAAELDTRWSSLRAALDRITRRVSGAEGSDDFYAYFPDVRGACREVGVKL